MTDLPITVEVHSRTSGYKIDYRLNAIWEQFITWMKSNYQIYLSIFLFNYYSPVVECLCTRKWNKSGPQEPCFINWNIVIYTINVFKIPSTKWKWTLKNRYTTWTWNFLHIERQTLTSFRANKNALLLVHYWHIIPISSLWRYEWPIRSHLSFIWTIWYPG